MRVGSTKIAKAFLEGKRARTANTRTNGTTIFLHGNAIVWKERGVIYFTLSGWNTRTTRERINQVFRFARIPLIVRQKDFAPYVYNYKTHKDEEISSRLPYTVSDFI